MTATATKPVPVTPRNPLTALNDAIRVAKAKVDAKGIQLRKDREAFERTGFKAPEGENTAALATAMAAYDAERQRLQSLERNHRPAVVLMDLLDDAADAKPMLTGAIKYLRAKANATPTPKVEAVIAAHVLPCGGLFGTPPPIDLDAELSKLETAIRSFPEGGDTFEKLTGALNRLDSEINARAAKAKPVEQARRMDKPFVVVPKPHASSTPLALAQVAPLPAPPAIAQQATRASRSIVNA
jgi:predicted Zn-dependent protease